MMGVQCMAVGIAASWVISSRLEWPGPHFSFGTVCMLTAFWRDTLQKSYTLVTTSWRLPGAHLWWLQPRPCSRGAVTLREGR